MPTGNLPASGKALWERVYEEAKKSSTCKDAGDRKDECAARVAWTAVKNAGWKKDANGNWHKSSFTEFSLRIERAAYDKATNERRWRAVASDTDEDSRQDSMSLELFSDFIERIQTGEPVPEPFRSDFWSGGMPYLSVSHYPDFNGDGVPGVVDSVYIDGSYLKAKGKFHDTPLGRKCFEAVCADLYSTKSEDQDKVRISIAFLDWVHKHKSNGFIFERDEEDGMFCPECLKELLSGEGQGKIFLSGHLVHLAMTRVPVNKRTDMEVDKSMADIKTRKDDAASIVGDELAEELEEKAKSKLEQESLVIRSDGEETPEIIEKEAIPIAVEQPVAVEIVEKPSLPYNGATSLKDAIALQEVQQEVWKLDELWYMTGRIIGNIYATDEIEDKASAIEDVLKEFKGMIKTKSEAFIAEAKTKQEEAPGEAEEECADNVTGEVDQDCLAKKRKETEMTSEVAESELVEEATKTEGGKSYPSSDYLVAEDPKKPSTWHLQVKRHGKPDHGLMGAAKAALTSPGGHRGNKYQGPDKEKALAKLKRLYASEKMEWTAEVEESEVEMPEVQTMSKADFEQIISVIRSTIAESINLVVKPVEPNQHPLDAAFTTFKAAYDQIDLMAGDEKERLQFIQEPFNQLGQAIVDVLKASVKKPEPETTHVPESPIGDLATILSKAIADAMQPVAQRLDLVSAQLQSKTDERVPARRSIPPSSVLQGNPNVKKSETPKLRAVIERTTL